MLHDGGNIKETLSHLQFLNTYLSSTIKNLSLDPKNLVENILPEGSMYFFLRIILALI